MLRGCAFLSRAGICFRTMKRSTRASSLAALKHAMAQNQLDLPPGVRYLVHNLHPHTWLRLVQADEHLSDATASRTLRGSRPGSPLADATFNLILTEILAGLERDIRGHPSFQARRETTPAISPLLCWVDDIAIPLRRPMEELIKHTMELTRVAFTRKSFYQLLPRQNRVCLNVSGAWIHSTPTAHVRH